METTQTVTTESDRALRVELPVFIFTRTITNTMVRMAYPFLPFFGRALGVDLYLLARAMTLRSASGIFGPLIASVGDSRGRKFGMLFGMTLFTAGAAIMVLRPSFAAFTLMLVLGIMTNFVFLPAMQAYLGDKVPYKRRGFVLALTEFGWSLAFIVGVPAVGLAISTAPALGNQLERLGLPVPAQLELIVPFAWLAAFGLASMVVLAWILPKDDAPVKGQSGIWSNLGLVLASPAALAGVSLGMAMSGGNELISLIFGVWLEDTFQVSLAALSAAAILIGASELGGEVLVTTLVDRLGKRRSVAIGLTCNALAALSLLWLGRSLAGALGGLFLFYLTFEFTMVSCLPMMTEVLPAARATFMASFIASTALGRALMSQAAPPLYDLGRSLELGSSLVAIAIATAVLDICGLAALRRIPRHPTE